MSERRTATAKRKRSKIISDETMMDFDRDTDFRVKFYCRMDRVNIPKFSSQTVDTNIIIRSPTKFSLYIKSDCSTSTASLQQPQQLKLLTTGYIRPFFKGRLKIVLLNNNDFDVTLSNDSHLGFVLCSPFFL